MVQEIFYTSKLDQTRQPAMSMTASGSAPRPLLVALHTWSYDHTSRFEKFAAYCEKNNWNFIFPEFRGPNWDPDACGSDFVISDLEDAVRFACTHANVDPRRIYLCGGSGGGHCSLLLAGRRPDIWAAVSAWCPITDVRLWHTQSIVLKREYYKHIERACGGNPQTDVPAQKQALLRSPLVWLSNAAHLPLAINCGIHDGHIGKGSVPIDQSIRAFNLLAKPEDRIAEADIAFMLQKEAVPEHLRYAGSDPAFGQSVVLFRRVSNLVRLTIFEGAHEIREGAALEWLARQKQGIPPDWESGPASAADTLGPSELTK